MRNLTDDVAAAHHDGFLAGDLDPAALQELDAAARGAWHEQRLAPALRQAPRVQRVEAVHVLLVGLVGTFLVILQSEHCSIDDSRMRMIHVTNLTPGSGNPTFS